MAHRSHPRLWLAAHIMLDTALAILVYFSRSLAALYLASLLVVIALLLDLLVARREYKGREKGEELLTTTQGC